jgi:DNA-binding response OmpR family regulator
MLKRAGFRVKIARDGEQALALVDLEEPELVVLDILIGNEKGASFFG